MFWSVVHEEATCIAQGNLHSISLKSPKAQKYYDLDRNLDASWFGPKGFLGQDPYIHSECLIFFFVLGLLFSNDYLLDRNRNERCSHHLTWSPNNQFQNLRGCLLVGSLKIPKSSWCQSYQNRSLDEETTTTVRSLLLSVLILIHSLTTNQYSGHLSPVCVDISELSNCFTQICLLRRMNLLFCSLLILFQEVIATANYVVGERLNTVEVGQDVALSIRNELNLKTHPLLIIKTDDLEKAGVLFPKQGLPKYLVLNGNNRLILMKLGRWNQMVWSLSEPPKSHHS